MTQQAFGSPPAANLWAVILAGEGGTGRQPRLPGSQCEDRQEARETPVGSISLLRQTLSRVRLSVPLERTVMVASRCHEIHLEPESPTPGAPRLVLRPRRRGTAADVLLAVHWIRRQDPGAAVAVFPSEQIVLEPYAFMQHVVMLAQFVERHDREIVIVGARPRHPDTQYEWIETAQSIPDSGHEPVWRVRSVRGCLSYSIARACYESGWLWNTSVTVARAEALVRAARRHSPELDAGIETAVTLFDTRYERRSLEACYAAARGASFSEAVLAGAPLLSASRLPSVDWSGRAVSEPGLPVPEPRGRFDGLVEQHSLKANVEACRAGEAISAELPWRAEPLEGSPWKPSRMTMSEPENQSHWRKARPLEGSGWKPSRMSMSELGSQARTRRVPPRNGGANGKLHQSSPERIAARSRRDSKRDRSADIAQAGSRNPSRPFTVGDSAQV